ncbi:MAG: cytochrome c maturation protein CcmE [Deltaproteobacteria bacterium]|nr:cytochrome c maturation protein CcmE [Deltaproteobacteria bacterium]
MLRALNSKWAGFVLAILVILGGLSVLFFGKLESNIVYFVTPTELLAKGDLAYEKPVRLGGTVKKGSIEWDPQAISLKFLLTDGSKEIPVASHSTPPQMFQDDMGVVVEGKLFRNDSFQADRLMVKHSNEYRPPKEGEKPTLLYKDLLK